MDSPGQVRVRNRRVEEQAETVSLEQSRFCVEILYSDVMVCEDLVQGWSGEVLDCMSHVVMCTFPSPSYDRTLRRPATACWSPSRQIWKRGASVTSENAPTAFMHAQ